METLVDLLEEAAGRYGERIAVSLEAGLRPESWSYRQLWRAAHAIARALQTDHNIGRGERVLILAPNSPHLVATYFGCLLAGIIVVPLDSHSSEALIARIAEKTQATAIITDRGLGGRAAASIPTVAGLRVIPLAQLPRDGPNLEQSERPHPKDIAEIVFTSGTTGAPKGVILTHRNIITNVKALDGIIPPNREYRLLSLLPLSHMLEQTVGLYLPLTYGASIFYLPTRQPAAIFKSLRKRRIVAMVVVPLVLDLMLKGIEREIRQRGQWQRWQHIQRIAAYLPKAARRLLFRRVHHHLGGCLDFFLCGGAFLPPTLAITWERLGITVVQGYGATECAPVVTTNTLHERMLGSVGRPMRGVQVRLSEEGEVLVKGPNVTPGYWQDEAATRAAFTNDGWYRTGDLGEQDASGRLYLKGRVRDLIVLPNGLNVYPEDVERELAREDGFADCVVLGLPDAAGNLRVHAVVLPAANAAADQQHIDTAVRRANARLAPHQRITGYTCWPGDDFPRTTTMKVKRHEVYQRIARNGQRVETIGQERGIASSPLSPRQQERPGQPDLASLQRILAEIAGVPATSIDRDSDLSADLGIDSLSRVELAIRLEEELGVLVDEGQLTAIATVGQLADLLTRRMEATFPQAFPRWALRRGVRVLRYGLHYGLLFPLHRLICRPFRVEGREHLGGLKSPILFIANHSSHLDTLSILRALPFPIRQRVAVAAAADYFYRDRRLGFLVTLALNTFPFSREGPVRASLEYCGELVDAGWSLLVYPEGTRSTTGTLQPFRGGIGLLARELRVPVVPVAVSGTYRVLPKGASWPRPGAVLVRFGKPLTMPDHCSPAELANSLETTLAALLLAGQRADQTGG